MAFQAQMVSVDHPMVQAPLLLLHPIQLLIPLPPPLLSGYQQKSSFQNA